MAYPPLPVSPSNQGGRGDLLVDGLHALLGQRARVFDRLAALAVGLAVQDAARTEHLLELWIFRIVGKLRLFFGV